MLKMILFVAVLVGGLVLGPEAIGNKGYVLVAFNNYTVESSLTSALLLLLTAFIAIQLLEWGIGRLLRIPSRTFGWFNLRKQTRANQLTVDANLAMAEGKYQKAEKMLQKSAKNSATPLLNYLNAARAAQAQGNEQQRDHYLELAQQQDPKAELALKLAMTELQLEQKQYDAAIQSLESLYAVNPRHPMVLQQLVEAQEGRNDWNAVIEHLPLLRKVGKITEAELQQQLAAAWSARLQGEAENIDALLALWQQVPKKLQQEEQLLLSYGTLLQQHGETQRAADLWLNALRHHYSFALASHLPKLAVENYHPLLAQLKKQAGEEGARLVIGELALRAELFDEAQLQLEAEVAANPSARVYLALAQLMEARQDLAQANHYYRLACAA